MYADTLGCIYAHFGCMSMERQSMRLLGAKYAETLGCMYAVVGSMYAETVGCKVRGCWVQSMRLLGACI